jgi:tetratricopeptide (TPR) repeat protein
MSMCHVFRLGFLLALGASLALAQVDRLPQTGKEPAKNDAPPRYEPDRDKAESSSKSSQIDLSPPPEDVKNHPYSGSATMDANAPEDGGMQEMRPWDPHKAAKDIEVGDFYFKRKNYRAALGRYQEALEYKPGDAVANFRLAQCFEKLDDLQQAVAHYHEYLKILPEGPLSMDAHKALDKLEGPDKNQKAEQTQPK